MISELDLATLEAIRSSVAKAVVSGALGELKNAEGALDRAEKRLIELEAIHPRHARPVRQARDAITMARRALRTPKHQSEEAREDRLAPRKKLLSTALRASARIGT